MNKAITDGIDFLPPYFEDGLSVWSSGDGTPGSTTYDTVPTAVLAPGDSDFGTCLEVLKTSGTQKVRFTGQTPILAGCYLKISARVKAISGNLPNVQIAGWAANSGGSHVSGLVEASVATPIPGYGDVVEVSAIVGTGNRAGVDMVWGGSVAYGHFGINLTGPVGGVVRIENIRIEDATEVFHRNLMDWVDVRDYGAIGDGIANDSAAFEAADLAANGRRVLVSAGTYYLADHVTFESEVRFEGTVVMPVASRLSLTKNFDLPSYIDAFGNEEEALKKALQALFNFSDHEGLDMGGRRVMLSAPLDVHAAVDNKDSYANRRVLRNGQLESDGSAAWDTEVFTETATYSAEDPTVLSAVTGLAAIPVGSLVEGIGVGREVYVRSKNVAAGTIELSLPLYAAGPVQSYTFKRFKYLLDFSGFTYLQRFNIADVEFLCMGQCSALMIPSDGLAFQVRDCFITTPLDRGITSIGHGCAGLHLDRNQFLSNEQTLDAGDRVTIAYNVNSNDTKIRDNRAVRFKHFGIMAGTGHMILSNHFFQGDNAQTDQRTAGLVISSSNCMTILGNNYVDNCSIDWTNEHDETPDNLNGFSFGGLTVDGNIFYGSNAPNWFSFLRLKPCGTGHYVNGLSVTGNTFRHSGGTLARVETLDDSIAGLDFDKFLNIIFEGNTFNNIDNRTFNPVTIEVSQSNAATPWDGDFAGYLPFGGQARKVVSIAAHNQIDNAANQKVFTMPYAVSNLGATGSLVRLHWSEPVKGKVYVTARVDNLG